MNTRRILLITSAVGVLHLLLIIAETWETDVFAGINRSMNTLNPGFTYQGYLEHAGEPVDGIFNLSFELFNAPEDGDSLEYLEVEGVPVDEGIFTVMLLFDPGLFDGDDRWLQIGVAPEGSGSFTILEGRQQITPTPYTYYAEFANVAGNADTVDGFHANQLGVNYDNLIIVAKSGGDFSSIQSALDSITDADFTNQYLVWVAPGVYSEQVTMKSFVHLQGSGRETTQISLTDISDTGIQLASYSSVSDLSVFNFNDVGETAAIRATAGISPTLVADVTAMSYGNGGDNYGIYITGSGTEVTLQNIIASGKNASLSNIGIYNYAGSTIVLQGGSYTGSGGITAIGLHNDSGIATLHGGTFTGRNGDTSYGIINSNTDARLDAENVTALAEYGTTNCGAAAIEATQTLLRGGSFTGRGGTDANGIIGDGDPNYLEAYNVIAFGVAGDDYNYGLQNLGSSTANLIGGTFTGTGGWQAAGIMNSAWVGTESTIAFGYYGSNSYGLYNTGGTAILNGGQFSGFNGMGVGHGIYIDSGNIHANSIKMSADTGYALFQDGGTVNLAVSQLSNGLFPASGVRTCFQVYDGNYAPYSCP